MVYIIFQHDIMISHFTLNEYEDHCSIKGADMKQNFTYYLSIDRCCSGWGCSSEQSLGFSGSLNSTERHTVNKETNRHQVEVTNVNEEK